MIKCPNCGTEARPNAKFCMNCGTALDGNISDASNDSAITDHESTITDREGVSSSDDASSSATDLLNLESAYEKSNAVSDSSAKNSNKSKSGKSKRDKSASTASSAATTSNATTKTSSKTSSGKAFSKEKKGVIVAVCIAAAMLLVAGVIFLSMPRGITTVGDGYEISGQRIAYSEDAYFIKGEAKNTTGHDEAFTLTYAIYNSDDEEIGNASCTVGPLNDGQSSEFQAQIKSNTTMFDLMLNGGQQESTGSPVRFELTNVALYTEGVNSTAEQFNQMFNMLTGFSSVLQATQQIPTGHRDRVWNEPTD